MTPPPRLQFIDKLDLSHHLFVAIAKQSVRFADQTGGGTNPCAAIAARCKGAFSGARNEVVG